MSSVPMAGPAVWQRGTGAPITAPRLGSGFWSVAAVGLWCPRAESLRIVCVGGCGSRTAPLSAEGATLPLYASPSWNKAGSWVHKSLQMALSDEAISIIMDSRQKAGPRCGLGALGPPPLLYSARGTGLTPVRMLHCASAPILLMCQVCALRVWNSAALCTAWCCQGDACSQRELSLHCAPQVSAFTT